MSCEFIFKAYRSKVGKEELFFYRGPVTQDVLVSQGSLLKGALDREKNVQVKKKIFSVFVEMSHNLSHHSAERMNIHQKGHEEDIGVGLISLCEIKGRYILSSGNLVDLRSTDTLKAYCQYLNTLDHEGLRDEYKERRRVSDLGKNKGAGLGLIEICKRSSHPLEFEFFEFDGERSFFALVSHITKGVGN